MSDIGSKYLDKSVEIKKFCLICTGVFSLIGLVLLINFWVVPNMDTKYFSSTPSPQMEQSNLELLYFIILLILGGAIFSLGVYYLRSIPLKMRKFFQSLKKES